MEPNKSNKNSKTKHLIEKYDSTAYYYDDRYALIQLKKYETILKACHFKDAVILDAGCGTGMLYSFLIDKTRTSEDKKFVYIGIDVSKGMLLNFRNKAGSIYSSQLSLSLILGDIQHLPFRKEIFDLIISVTTIQNLENMKRGIEELLKTSKPISELRISVLDKKNYPSRLKHIFTQFNKSFEIIDEKENEDILFIVKNKQESDKYIL